MQPNNEKGCWHSSHTLMQKTDISNKTLIVNICREETRAFSSKDRWLEIWILVARMKECLESVKSQVRCEGYTECNYGLFALL